MKRKCQCKHSCYSSEDGLGWLYSYPPHTSPHLPNQKAVRAVLVCPWHLRALWFRPFCPVMCRCPLSVCLWRLLAHRQYDLIRGSDNSFQMAGQKQHVCSTFLDFVSSKQQVQVRKVANRIILKRDPDLFVENRPQKLSLGVIMYCLYVSTLPKSVFPVLCGLCNLCRPTTWTRFQRKSWLTAADRSCHGNIVMMVRICAAQLSITILKQTPLFLLLPTKRVREVCCFSFFAVTMRLLPTLQGSNALFGN